jgi:transcriptional regulator with XRE-family HTH domain
MNLGEKLKELRKSKNLNQSDVAKIINVDRSTYGKYETGDSSPDYDKLIKLADYFRVTIDELLGRGGIFDIGWALKEERESQGLTTKELGDFAGVDEQKILHYEEDEIPISLETAQKIAEFFGMTYIEFLDKYNLYDGYVHPQFLGDVNAQQKFDEAVERDVLNETANKTKPLINKDNLPELTAKDERDVKKELQKMIDDLNNQNSYAAYDGQTINDMDEEDRELLIASLENSLRLAKRLAKQKFTPKKYRK